MQIRNKLICFLTHKKETPNQFFNFFSSSIFDNSKLHTLVLVSDPLLKRVWFGQSVCERSGAECEEGTRSAQVSHTWVRPWPAAHSWHSYTHKHSPGEKCSQGLSWLVVSGPMSQQSLLDNVGNFAFQSNSLGICSTGMIVRVYCLFVVCNVIVGQRYMIMHLV